MASAMMLIDSSFITNGHEGPLVDRETKHLTRCLLALTTSFQLQTGCLCMYLYLFVSVCVCVCMLLTDLDPWFGVRSAGWEQDVEMTAVTGGEPSDVAVS